MKNRRARELQKWQKGELVRLREGVQEAFAKECAGAERVPLVDVATMPPLQTVERHLELLGELAVTNAEFLASNGWRELVVNKRGRSAINPDVGSMTPRHTWNTCKSLGHLPTAPLDQKRPRSCRQRRTEAPARPLRLTVSSCGKRRMRCVSGSTLWSCPCPPSRI